MMANQFIIKKHLNIHILNEETRITTLTFKAHKANYLCKSLKINLTKFIHSSSGLDFGQLFHQKKPRNSSHHFSAPQTWRGLKSNQRVACLSHYENSLRQIKSKSFYIYLNYAWTAPSPTGASVMPYAA